ncbi:hypothetical protein DM01DRAFT_1387111 [Hesseltinella vesiculosa]|uniref:Uncharacterized protein n=1 Tax=Hesseltinella vesiculosa TaxID=101127 RepID=A0A1X2G3B9_9FUNG|nr:hypothetical protein DM01DRAFT_1387111 [Hesseltinella vesiculosa]
MAEPTTLKSPALRWLDHQADSPMTVWGLSAFNLAVLPLAAKSVPGMPSVIQSIVFSAIYGGAGYVSYVGDSENGAGIATAWCLSWSFLNARRAIQSARPAPLLMVLATSYNIAVYGTKTLKVNGYIQ